MLKTTNKWEWQVAKLAKLALSSQGRGRRVYLELLLKDEDDGEGWLTNVSLYFCFSFPFSLISGLYFCFILFFLCLHLPPLLSLFFVYLLFFVSSLCYSFFSFCSVYVCLFLWFPLCFFCVLLFCLFVPPFFFVPLCSSFSGLL